MYKFYSLLYFLIKESEGVIKLIITTYVICLPIKLKKIKLKLD